MASREEARELVEQLRKRGLSNGGSLGCHSGLYDEAADMIEALLQENQVAPRCGECLYSVNSKMPCAYKCNNRRSPCYGRITYADFGCLYGAQKER